MQVTFTNRIALFFWVFALVFLAMTGLMTWLVLRDGIPAGNAPLFTYAVMAAFWLAGIALAALVAKRPCVTTGVAPDGSITVVRRYPLRSETKRYPRTMIVDSGVHESTDSDGDAYFRAVVTTRDGSEICLAEGGVRSVCDDALARFNQALGR